MNNIETAETTKFSQLSRRTQRYLELISGKKDQKALDAWMAYTGFSDHGKQCSPSHRIDLANKGAEMHFLQRSSRTLRPH